MTDESTFTREDLRVSVEGGVGWLTMDRPRAMNALTLEQVRAMTGALRAWADDDRVRLVVIEGAGDQAFCAGGDIRALYEAYKRGDLDFQYTFYREKYALNQLIYRYPKPFVAFMDGMTMGGGAGVSVHGSHRVATENLVYAMPETGVGLFPDVGHTWFLPRRPGHTGYYLGLIGARIQAADAMDLGITTHFIPRERLPEVRQALSGVDAADDAHAAVTWALDLYQEVPGAGARGPLMQHQNTIERCFARDSVEGVRDALAAEGGPFAEQTLASLAGRSPTSLKVTLKALRAGAALDFERALMMEYRLATRFMHGHDFFEGIRALLVDRDKTPQWWPTRLEAVDESIVDAYFKPMETLPELTFG